MSGSAPGPIVYVDRSRIREGKLAALEGAMTDLARFVRENEPQMLSYGFFLDAERKSMTVVAVHPDSESMEFHMSVAGPKFVPFGELIELESIDVYGEASQAVLDSLRAKAQMLGTGTVNEHRLSAGFFRVLAQEGL